MSNISLAQIQPKKTLLNVNPSYWSPYEGSSASYGASRQPDGSFMIFRFPHLNAGVIKLGRCLTAQCAEARLDWWVARDTMITKLIIKAMQDEVEPDLLGMIVQSAMDVPSPTQAELDGRDEELFHAESRRTV